jgi:hypothetical protein
LLPLSTAGLSHLADDGSDEGVRPSGALALSADGHRRAGTLEQVEGEGAEDLNVMCLRNFTRLAWLATRAA